MSSYAPASPSHEPAPAPPPTAPPEHGATYGRGGAATAAQRTAMILPAALTVAVLCLSTFVAGGGLNLESTTTVELTLTLLAGLAAAAAIAFAPAGAPLSGAWPIALLFALAALTGISVAWSVAPDASWRETGQLVAYGAVFAAAALLARAAPGRWQGVLAGVVIAAVAVCGYALLAKVLPAQLDRDDPYARLRVPYEYWNATGLAAAIGIVACLWLGTRRSGHALASALAYPATGLLIVTLLLAYSRGALAAGALGAAAWLCLVRRRLRGAAMLIVCATCAGAIVAFDFSSSALSSEAVALSRRVSAGHQLGVLLLAMLLVLTLAGVAIGFAAGRRPLSPRARRRAGALLIGLLALTALAGVGALASTRRGLTGTVSHAFSSLTNPNAAVPSNTPDRLTAVGSVRARYWKQALQVFEAHPAIGVGGGGYATARRHYEASSLVVTHAHGYIVQTLADLGLAGAALTAALLVAWLVAAGRATHPFARRWSGWRWRALALPYDAERIGLLTMLAIVITFGLHSLVDWTWYVPGTACVALICAGWLAGRGPIERAAAAQAPRWRHLPPHVTRPRLTPLRAAFAAAAILAALVAAWSEWQPQRSAESSQQALALLPGNPTAALAAAQAGVSEDPLSFYALSTLADVEQALGEEGKARRTRERAVREQPANPQAWRDLGEHDLEAGDPSAALSELRAAYYLDPGVVDRNDYVLALRAAAAARAARATAPAPARLRSAPASRSRASSRARLAPPRRRRS
jgi:hypothetical protein